jgi:hypothetical protein
LSLPLIVHRYVGRILFGFTNRGDQCVVFRPRDHNEFIAIWRDYNLRVGHGFDVGSTHHVTRGVARTPLRLNARASREGEFGGRKFGVRESRVLESDSRKGRNVGGTGLKSQRVAGFGVSDTGIAVRRFLSLPLIVHRYVGRILFGFTNRGDQCVVFRPRDHNEFIAIWRDYNLGVGHGFDVGSTHQVTRGAARTQLRFNVRASREGEFGGREFGVRESRVLESDSRKGRNVGGT